MAKRKTLPKDFEQLVEAGTVQGEVARISGRLAYELLDNGGINI